MKSKLLFLGLVLLIFFFQGCATMPRQEKSEIVKDVPQISPIKVEEEKRSLKRKVAIARFTNETKYGQSFFVDGDNNRIGKQAMDILSAKLASTDKFILLERADIEKINSELEMGGLEKLNIPADYLIIGSVSEFGRKTTSDVGIFSRTKKQGAYAKVNIRLIDVATGQIIYSEEGAGEAFSEAGSMMGVGDRAGHDSTLNDKAISAAISKIVSNVIENLLDKPWRAYILSYEEGTYIVSGGEKQGVMIGDSFDVYKKGKQVFNPQTNMPITLPGKQIGKIEVVATVDGDINSEVSICTPISGEIPKSGFENIYIEAPKN